MAETPNELGWTKVLSKHHMQTTTMNKDTTDIDMQDNNANQITPGTQTETQKPPKGNITKKNTNNKRNRDQTDTNNPNSKTLYADK